MVIEVGTAGGDGKPAAALSMVDGLDKRQVVKVRTLGADKGYDGGQY